MTKQRPHLALDGYKTGHQFQYPKGTTWVYSNLTARSASHFRSEGFDGKTVFVGLQGFIKSFLIDTWNEGFFNRPKEEVVTEYKRRMDNYLGPDAVPVDHIAALHDMGYLPLLIRALPEGSRVNLKVPYLTIENTDSDFFWLTNYVETILSAELWHPITAATIAYEYRRILNKYVELTGANKDFADWQLHDFSMRGMSGLQPSVGAAHLMVAGYGTDTLPAIDYLEDYYGANSDTELVGGSVPATEHSVMCMGGKSTEIETFKRLITDTYPSGVVSIVSDTWDFWKVITEYAAELKEDILSRQPNALGLAKVVFRPDSGDPVKIISGLTFITISDNLGDVNQYYNVEDTDPDVICLDNKFYEYSLCSQIDRYGDEIEGYIQLDKEVPSHVVKGAVECLDEIFGHTVNEKGYKTLNQRVGLIYGDSITLEREEAILQRLMDKGYAADNIVFGVGSYSYQYNTRDTFGMAVKATAGEVNGEFLEIEKDPATGDGMKKSAKGRLVVTKDGNDFVLHDQQPNGSEYQTKNCLEEVFFDGELIREHTLAEIRQRIKEG